MIRTLLITAALGAMALPAAAATSVTVNVGGLDAKATHATIVRAARSACSAELRDSSPLEQYYLQPECMRAAIARAESTLTVNGAVASTQTRVAGR